ncbi:MAG: hypothetical protein NC922_02550 [Candidatus Omnitrophica bacterium]|nr:hypothetical protein [Candidatus Omnitrophota bacterium]
MKEMNFIFIFSPPFLILFFTYFSYLSSFFPSFKLRHSIREIGIEDITSI